MYASNGTSIIRTFDGAFIPTDPDNADYQDYLVWVSAGNVPASPTPPTLADLKAAKHQEINALRDQAEAGGFSYLGHVFDSDMRSAQRISIAAQAAAQEPAFSIGWTTADNVVVTLDQAGMLGMPVALANNAYLIHSKAYVLKTMLDAATTADQVAAIIWS